MNEEWNGSWWRVGSELRVGGQLRLGDTGVELVLFGTFFDWTGFDFVRGVGFPLREPQRVAVIHGLTPTPVSVLNARCDFPLPPGADGFEAWHAGAIVDTHVVGHADTEPMFTGVRFELESLPPWARARGIAQRIWLDGSRTEIAVQAHDLATGRLASGELVTIEQRAHTSQGHLEYRINQPVTIAIEDCRPATWEELLNRWLQPLQVLLWLATGSARRVGGMDLRVEQADEFSPIWAKLSATLVEPTSGSTREPHPHDVLFFADELPGGFANGLGKWLLLWEDLRHVLGPLYARASAPFAYANDRFYTAVAAIEAYHRHCVDSDRDLPTAQHRQRVRRVEGVLSEHAPDLVDWAVNAVKPFNRVPLWRRIAEIAETLPVLSADLFGSGTVTFAKAVEDSRHGHAHALERARSIEGGPGLYVAADALTWLLRACIMIDLGIGLDSTQARIRRHERFEWTAHRARDLLC